VADLKTIMIISDAWHPQINGVVRTYEHVIEELERTGHSVKVIGPRDFQLAFSMPGYSEIKLALFPYLHLSRLIKRHAPDGIHIATEGPLGWAARRYCVKHNVGYTTAYHTHFPDYMAERAAKYWSGLRRPAKKFGIWYARKFHSTSSAMLVATNSLAQDLERWGFKTPRYNFSRGVNYGIFNPDGAVNGIKNRLRGPVAIYVGRIAIEKNLRAFLDMPWQGDKLIVGSGPDTHRLKARYPEAHFVGAHKREALAAYYRCGDVFVFPSKTDTFGMVLIEAMACGLPLAGYNVTGPKDIITEDFIGALDDNDLSAAALRALANGKANSNNSAAMRVQYAKDHYSWANAAQEFMLALHDAVNKIK
jgi:glycosyltransferase involved in cell wall biosynthesis